MKLCPSCHRHLRAPEARCPFCGAEQRSAPDHAGPGLVAAVLLSAMLVACTDRSPGESDTNSSTSATTTPTDTTTTAGTPTTSGPTSITGPDGTTSVPTSLSDGSVSASDPTLDTGDEGCAFYAGCPGDVGTGHLALCDVFAQDCAPGEKCTAWGPDSSWTGTKCVPVTGDKAPGEPCTAPMGGVAGIDDCALGAMCFSVEDNQGECVALCTGSPDAPVCPASTVCIITNNDVLNLCLPTCDPLAQDCPEGDLCVGVDDDFICVFDISGDTGGVNDVCFSLNECDPGLVCLSVEEAGAACLDVSCCEPFCDLTKMQPCPNPDQACVPWFDPMNGMVPPGSEDVGVCKIPA